MGSQAQDPGVPNELAPRDILDTPAAGPRVIRGTATRTGGYFAGLALAVVAAPLLTRHLGVADYGSFVVVASLVAIAAIFADAGLSPVGIREYTVRDADGRRRLLQNLVSARLAASALAGLGAVLFTVVVGYERVLVVGTAVGALGLAFTMVQRTYAIPLFAALRLELATALDLLRQALTVAGIVVLVFSGAGLLAFLVLPLPVAVAVLVATLIAVRGYGVSRPAVGGQEARYLLGEMPAAAASVLGALFYRVAIVMMSLLATAEQTGYFGISLQVVDVFIAVPTIIGGSALPVLARAADTDRQRLASAFRQLFDASVVLGIGAAYVLVVGAQPIIAFLGGADFAPAVSVLRIQGLAVAVTFLVTLFGYMLWVVRAKHQLVTGNLVGFAAAILLTAALVPIGEAEGAAFAMLIAESILALWLGVALLRKVPEARPSMRAPAKALLAVSVAVGIALTSLPPVAEVVLGGSVYVAMLVVLRAIPLEVWRATFSGMRPG
jgi:O-antigen/teichoic acid export membrane protein